MQINVCAVGRLRAGPEYALINDYLARFNRAGQQLGLGPAFIHEVEDKRGVGMAAEADLLRRAIPERSRIAALDERGKMLNSREFAELLARWRDDGTRTAALLIGGADGISSELPRRSRLDDILRPDGMAAYACARDACRAIVSCGVNSGWNPLSPRIAVK